MSNEDDWDRARRRAGIPLKPHETPREGDVGTSVEVGRTIDSPLPGSAAGDREREAVSLAIRDDQVFDVATLSEEQFEHGLQQLKRRQQRMQQILDTVLVEGVHYGNPTIKGTTKKAFEKPMLLQAGAEELAKFFRLTCRHAEPPIIAATRDYCTVTVSLGCFDIGGRLITVRSASCNSLEKRFKRGSGGWTYTDAREVVHQCLTMAEKRAQTLVVRAATGATGFFAAEEEMERALAEDEVQRPLSLQEALDFPLPGEAKSWGGNGGKPLAAIRNNLLKAVREWCIKQLEEDEEAAVPRRLLEAVQLVIAARDAGTHEQPPKPSITPVSDQGYPTDAPTAEDA